jgi:hypothetical protein
MYRRLCWDSGAADTILINCFGRSPIREMAQRLDEWAIWGDRDTNQLYINFIVSDDNIKVSYYSFMIGNDNFCGSDDPLLQW